MAKYKLCDCGRKVFFEGAPPKKCPFCGRRNIQSKDAFDEDEVVSPRKPAEPEPTPEPVDVDVPEIWFSLDTLDGAHSIAVPREGCIVGREGSGADWLGEDLAVSRTHFAVFYQGTVGLTIRDLSRGGTFLNEERLEPDESGFVKNGDLIRMHQTEFRAVRHEKEETE